MKKVILVLCCGVFLSIGGKTSAQSNATFNYVTNAVQTWVVPCGVTTVTAQLWGAGGGSGHQTGYTDAWCGGSGAYMEGTLTGLTSGTTLKLYVPQGGGYYTTNIYAPGGWPGGGTAGCDNTFSEWGGAGGGYAAVEIGATYYAVAGAGGGGGSTGYGGTAYGGGGGNPNSTITVGSFGANGGPGLLASGGAGGAAYSVGGTAGTALTGGTGEPQSYNGDYGGGGGGAGWYGGGGGGDEGNAGGGGSSFPGSTYTSGGVTFTILSNLAGTTNSATSGSAAAPGGPPVGIGAGNIAAAGGNGYVKLSWIAPAALSVSASIAGGISCNGGSNGSVLGTVTGGTSPYTYVWTPSSQTTATATGLSAGTYSVGVSDACGNTASASVALTQPLVLAATATTSTNVTCNGGSTGATASAVTGGTTPYSYLWTGGSTNATATGLTAGSYTLSVTDMNGCSATASTVVTQPNALSDSAFTIKNVLCNGGNTGSASNIAKGGNAPYTYLWTPGGATKDTASGLSAGTYTLMVSDACGASATASATITQPTAISITSHSAPDNGHGVGTAVVSVSGGVGPYTYLWNPGGNTTDSIGGKTKGTYCCDVKDANGCKDSICVVIKTTAGIDGITGNSAQIVVYPNPNNGQFTIESSVGGASSVEIYNVLGEKVFTGNLSTTKGTNTINIGNQPNGVYLYRVISESGDLLGEGKITLQK